MQHPFAYNLKPNMLGINPNQPMTAIQIGVFIRAKPVIWGIKRLIPYLGLPIDPTKSQPKLSPGSSTATGA